MVVEVIDGEAVDVTPPRALAVVPDSAIASVGVIALAALSDDEFDRRLAALESGRDRIARIQRALMEKDVDYGTIPGTPKPTLLKPGAEKLCTAYGLAADFIPERRTGDGVLAPALAYMTRCELHLGSLDGPVVGVGYGSANSWERKHRYRNAERACPACGNATGALMKSKREPEWFCWGKKGGCGATFKLDDPAVAEQVIGQVENPDPWDLDTTLLKMAEKRAHVDATLRTTAASGLFTQDAEDHPRDQLPATPAADPETGEVLSFRPSATDPGGLIGTAGLGKKDSGVDWELRQGPDGAVLPFKLTAGRTGWKVIAPPGIAEPMAEHRALIEKQRVTCWGRFEDESFTSPGGHPVTYQVLHLSRIETPAGTFPLKDAPSEPIEDGLDGLGAEWGAQVPLCAVTPN